MLVERSFAAGMALAMALTSCGSGSRLAGPYPPYPSAPAGPFAAGPDQVTVFYSGTAFSEIDRRLRAAVTSIQLEMYELGDTRLKRDLVDAAQRRVSTNVIVDPTVSVTAASEAWLRNQGVSVHDYPVRAKMIDHVKLLIVDGRVAIVGGINWGSSSDQNKDFDLEIVGPAVINLAHIFGGDLVICGGGSEVAQTVPDPGVLVMATLPEVQIEPAVLDAIDGAATSIDLEMYTLTDSAVVHALVRARSRGASVRVLLDHRQATTNMNAYDQLVAGGLTPHWYLGPGLLHAKAMVVDDRLVIVGSANWTASGFAHNHEVDVEIPSQEVAGAFETGINATWKWAD